MGDGREDRVSSEPGVRHEVASKNKASLAAWALSLCNKG
jgi:hypothetical protein